MFIKIFTSISENAKYCSAGSQLSHILYDYIHSNVVQQ